MGAITELQNEWEDFYEEFDSMIEELEQINQEMEFTPAKVFLDMIKGFREASSLDMYINLSMNPATAWLEKYSMDDIIYTLTKGGGILETVRRRMQEKNERSTDEEGG